MSPLTLNASIKSQTHGLACEQAFGRVGNWGERKAKRPVDKHLGLTAPAVHQILMQAPFGESTDCRQD